MHQQPPSREDGQVRPTNAMRASPWLGMQRMCATEIVYIFYPRNVLRPDRAGFVSSARMLLV